ncbi:uncharacterized protein ACR2FA_012653 [Aphomia sociella]
MTERVIDKSIEMLLKEFKEVFAEGLSTYTKSRIHLHLTDKTPVFVKARPLPLALRAPVERELERLQRDDVIYKVDRSDYGTPVVPIIKKNGSIRICGDYKVTINPLLKDFHYPLPRIEEIFANLAGVDSSAYGLGAVLTHRFADGSERLISCSSRTLNAAERNYSQIDKEALAIVFGIKRHHQYLYGRHFLLRSDHRALSYIFGKNKGIPQTAASRLQRYAVQLAAYNFDIEFVPSKKNEFADALSRLPLEHFSDSPYSSKHTSPNIENREGGEYEVQQSILDTKHIMPKHLPFPQPDSHGMTLRPRNRIKKFKSSGEIKQLLFTKKDTYIAVVEPIFIFCVSLKVECACVASRPRRRAAHLSTNKPVKEITM